MPHPSLAPFESSWLWLSLVTLGVLLILAGWGWAAYQWLPGLRLNSEPVAFAAECLLLGLLGFSLLGFGGIQLRVPLHDTFLAGTAAIVLVAFPRRRRWRPAAPGLRPGIGSPSALLLLALVLSLAGSLLWSVSSFPGLSARTGGIVLVPWVDFFFHARQIGDFAHFASDAEALNPIMAGRPLPPYHYGSYMVPALVAKLAGASSIQVATSLYPVLGLALTGVAMLVLAHSTAGAGAALLAVGLLFLLPDASCWQAAGSPTQSYFFLQQVGGGGACAVALMGWALACACQGFGRRSWLLCGFALLLFGMASLFKMQLVLAYGGFFALFVVAGAPWRARAWAWAAGVACVACGVTFAAVTWRLRPFPQAPTFTLVPGPAALLPTPPASAWSPLPEIWALYGALLPMAAVLVWALRKDALASRMARLLLLNLVAFACVRFLIADSRDFGALGEINRRTFVWPYFVMVYGCAVLLWRWLQTRAWTKAWKLSIVAASGLGLAAQAARSAALLQCWPGVGPGLTNVPIAGGLVESAAYLKLHSAPHETLQPCQSDAYNALAALAERPVYVSGTNVEASASPGGGAERMRLGVVQQVVKAARREDAVAALEQAGIAWFVMSPDCQAPWQTQWAPAWQAQGYRMYQVRPVKAPA